jgi:hypothetical protein
LCIGIAFALSACGGGDDPSVSASGDGTTTTPSVPTTPATPDDTSATRILPGFRTVEYGGLQFAVPDDWPVYDLAQELTRCARFDQHAVYLGHAGPDQDCPAQLIGRTDAIQIEPLDATSEATAARATEPSTTLNGLPIRIDPNHATTRSLIAVFESAGVVATLTFADDDTLVQQILAMVGSATQ